MSDDPLHAAVCRAADAIQRRVIELTGCTCTLAGGENVWEPIITEALRPWAGLRETELREAREQLHETTNARDQARRTAVAHVDLYHALREKIEKFIRVVHADGDAAIEWESLPEYLAGIATAMESYREQLAAATAEIDRLCLRRDQLAPLMGPSDSQVADMEQFSRERRGWELLRTGEVRLYHNQQGYQAVCGLRVAVHDDPLEAVLQAGGEQ